MKTAAFLLTALSLAASGTLRAGQNPKGSALELHSCRLYAGGCLVSSESTQGGHYMVRAWKFSDGEYGGVKLRGLEVAVLQVADDNLAAPGAKSAKAVLYLPEAATAAQRTALQEWLIASDPGLAKTRLKARVVPVSFTEGAKGCELRAGSFISVNTITPETCVTGSCGEALWYSPRTRNNVFTVVLNEASSVVEPALELKWEDSGKKSAFLCKFGEATPVSDRYVTVADLCGSGSLFR